MKCLLLVDLQNGFCPGGNLPVPEGDAVIPIANRLNEVGVPFMFATGYGEQSQLPDQHKSRPVLQKPYTLASLSRRLGELLDISKD